MCLFDNSFLEKIKQLEEKLLNKPCSSNLDKIKELDKKLNTEKDYENGLTSLHLIKKEEATN